MKLSGRPLVDNRLDRVLYLRRPAHAEVLEAVTVGRTTLVLGARGSGKTTLLSQVAGDIRQRGLKVSEIPGHLATTPTEFARLVRARAGSVDARERLLTPGMMVGSERWVDEPDEGSYRWDQSGDVQQPLEVIQLLASELGDEPHVVLCDEPTPKVAHTMFGRLRDQLWQLPLTWVVAANSADQHLYQVPPADAFFERVVLLGDLSPAEQRQLLELRLEGDTSLQRQLEGIEGHTPRDLLSSARGVLEEGRDPRQASGALAELYATASSLGRSASMALAEVLSLGPVSASDPQLLQRTGWTRERATHVLNQLEQAGVVESFSEKRERSGRPRKVYRVRLAS